MGLYKQKPKHDYSNTQVSITGDHAAAMRAYGASIPDKDLAADGREKETHITVKYGLSDEAPTKKLKEALAGFGPVTATLGKTSLFENDDADVLKVDIDSPDLHRLNRLIGRTVPTPGNSHPKYIPHATIAYMKPGKGKPHSGKSILSGRKITFDRVTFSGKDGNKTVIPLGEKKNTPYQPAI